jgi:ABC-type antimicrobial peptide transport system permease subunit
VTDLKGGEQPGAGGLRIGGVRGGLIVAQVAMSVVFTASAGLTALGIARMASEGRADARQTLVSRVDFLPGAGDSSHVETVLAEVLDGVSAIPGVEAASAAAFIPIRGSRVTVYGETKSAGGELKKRELDGNLVRPGYMTVAGIPVLRGRDFERRDVGGAPVAIVSKSMADALWPGEDAIAKRIKINDHAAAAEIIGVVADPPGFEPATDRSYPGMIYLPLAASREAEVILHLRVPSGQDAVASQVHQFLKRYTTQLVAPKAITLDDYLDGMLLPLRLIAEGSVGIAAVQFLLAIAGLSGLVAYVTELRRREIGIRTALGATRGSVLRLVMRQGLRLTAVGGVIGLGVSGIVANVIADSLPITPAIVAGGLLLAGAVFGAIGIAAMLVPARRALKVGPAAALRVD